MAPKLESGVQERMDDPEAGEEVTLLIKLEEASAEAVERLEAAGATVEEEIPLDYVAVTAYEADLRTLSQTEGVTRIEIEGSGSVMSSGFQTRAGSAH
jgi:hypothetical protein